MLLLLTTILCERLLLTRTSSEPCDQGGDSSRASHSQYQFVDEWHGHERVYDSEVQSMTQKTDTVHERPTNNRPFVELSRHTTPSSLTLELLPWLFILVVCCLRCEGGAQVGSV
jgi:hypothetical protein